MHMPQACHCYEWLVHMGGHAASLGFITTVQVECPSVTPSVVLEASGHVERFTDFMVQDAVTKDCHRADHLLEDALETALRDAAKTGLMPERIEVGSPSHERQLHGMRRP